MTLYNLQYITVIIAFAFLACEYSPDAVYTNPVNQEVQEPEITEVELSIDSNADTIYIYTDKIVQFSFSSSTQEIIAVSVAIDNEPDEYINGNNGSFNTLNLYDLDEGIHSLQLNTYTHSGTNSIADILEAETFIFEKNWVVVVDKSYYKNTKYKVDKGVLTLEWQQYKGSDFKEYTLCKGLNGYTMPYKTLDTAIFQDLSYVGEECQYIIYVKTIKGTELYWGTVSMPNSIPELSYSVSDSNIYTLNIEESQFYHGIDSILLLDNNTLIKSITNYQDTTYVISDGKYADHKWYEIRVIPKYDKTLFNQYTNRYESHITIDLGKKLLESNSLLQSISQVSNDEFIYVGNSGGIYRYSTSAYSVVDKIKFDRIQTCSSRSYERIEVSASGKSISAYAGCEDDVFLMSSTHLSNNLYRNLKHFTGQNYVPSIPISDTGIGAVRSKGSFVKLYDFNSNKVVASKLYHVYSLQISTNSNYVFINGGSYILAKRSYNTFTDIWSESRFSSELKYFTFHGTNPEQAIVWDGVELMLKDCNTFNTLKAFKLSDEHLCNIDFYNKRFLTYNNKKLLIRNLDNGDILQEVEINFSADSHYYKCYLINNIIINQSGLMHNLNL